MPPEQPRDAPHLSAKPLPDGPSQQEDGEISDGTDDSLSAIPMSRTSSGDRMKALETQSAASQPPLPYDEAPPEDDGWEPLWAANANAYYFYNRYTGASQWENPRIPQATATNYGSYDRFANSSTAVVTTSSGAPGTSSPPKRSYGGYNPKIHGNYDPNADYAKEAEREEEEQEAAASAAAAAALAAASGVPKSNAQDYATTAHFNRFTGRYQQADKAEYHNDENKSKRQMNAFFDVDAAANSHDGRSLKAERRGKQLSKQEIKAFQTKRRERKDEKRRNWLTKD